MTDDNPTAETFSRFQKDHASLIDLVKSQLVQKPVHPTLFHYTDAHSAQKIIESNQLWASHARFMNDMTELDYGIQLYKDVIEHFHDVTPRDEYLKFRDFLPKSNHIFNRTPIYFACFSEDGNDLSQWRAYCKEGTGYALGFDAATLDNCRYLRNELFYVKVDYDRATQESRLKDLISSVFHYVGAAKDVGNPMTARELGALWVNLITWIQLLIVGMKRNDFRHEKEWRLVFRNLVSFENTHPDFRVSETGVMVPYCVFKPSGSLPIKTVTIGPTSNRQIAFLGFRKLMAKYGHDSVEIKHCEIPLRSL